jgi:hypothetical protein
MAQPQLIVPSAEVAAAAKRPRSMRDPAVRARRRAMLDLPHMRELASYAQRLRQPGLEVPDFDPRDAGVEASVLFLFEKPGPMTAQAGNGRREGFKSNAKWTLEEDRRLLEMKAAGKSHRSIGAALKRTPGSVNSRSRILKVRSPQTDEETPRGLD